MLLLKIVVPGFLAVRIHHFCNCHSFSIMLSSLGGGFIHTAFVCLMNCDCIVLAVCQPLVAFIGLAAVSRLLCSSTWRFFQPLIAFIVLAVCQPLVRRACASSWRFVSRLCLFVLCSVSLSPAVSLSRVCSSSAFQNVHRRPEQNVVCGN